MASLGPHASFILLSYAFTVLVLAALIIGSVASHRRARQRLAELSAGRDTDA
jgi:heme exporter protein D